MANVVSLVVVQFMFLVAILSLQKATDCHEECSAIGLDDSNIIPDSSFTASSELRDEYGANKARFSSDRCWEPNGNANEYLQIDLGKVFVICAVATKGNAHNGLSEWTTEYKISTSSDGNLWLPYSETNNSPKLFPGNTDRNTAVKNDLAIPILAKLVRFTPTKYRDYKALRVEVYGFDGKGFSCSSLPIGVASVAEIPDNSMTSSSQYNTSTPPSNGRLGYTAGSSWCAAGSDSSPYLRVKLGSPDIICGVATQGDHKSDNWVQTYQIQTSTDGSAFKDYRHDNGIQDFVGNTDRDTVIKNPLYEGTVSEYVRIKPKSNYGTTSCMRTELYGVSQITVCSKMSIGVSYANLVPDHRFTTSSYFSVSASDNRYIPSNARLRTNKAWEPKTNNPQADNWMQIDLGSVVYVCAVATQGNAYPAVEYVRKYRLRISLDNVNWEYYKENNADKIFTGNTDRTNIVTNTLATPTKTKFLRFYPTDFHGYAAMRVDVYGVPTTCSSPFGLEKGGSIKDRKMTSSSQSNSGHAASFGRLYGDASWCSNVQVNTEYLQVDLDKMVTLTGITTQGDRTMDKWVKTYTLKYSIDGNTWNEYREGQPSAKMFQGNSDKSSIVVRWLTHLVTVRYVRVFSQTWNTGICMRVELFGCNCPFLTKVKDLPNKILSVSPSSHVDLECNVQEPLIQYIDWYSGITDVTHLSSGITRTATSVKSVLRVNFTSANSIFNDYKCSNTSTASLVDCRKNVVCRAKYVKANSNADPLNSAQVVVNLEKPSALTTPSLGNILSRSTVVSWTQPALKLSQASILSYVIKYWHQSTTKVIIPTAQDRSKSISGLSVCTEYNVSITSYSVLGPGPWSGRTTFKTDPEKPTIAPGNIQAQAKTSQIILVTWQVPAGVRCPPSGYKVTFTKTQGVKNTVHVNDGQATYKILDNLEKWTQYSITVLVFNDKGDGPASRDVVKRTLEDKPDAPPQNLVASAKSPTQIDVSWDPPPADKQNGLIRGYKVSYCKTGQCFSPTVKAVTSSSTTLNGLDMYTEYTFKVLAYTNVGNGPYSNSPFERTLEGPPSKPTNVKISIIDPVGPAGPHIKVVWKPPLYHNGIIRNYSVSYGQSGDENKMILDDNTLTCTLNACGGVTYKVKVWAITVTDGSKVERAITVPIYAPKKASIKTIYKYNATTYNVIFQPLPDANGPITIYEIELARIKDGITQKTTFVKMSCKHQVQCHGSGIQVCSQVLHDFPQCATYSIRVRAYTSKGPGPFSGESTFLTSAPGSPRNLKALEMSQTTAKLKWSKPQPLAKPVEKYVITYRWWKTYSFNWHNNITSAVKEYDNPPSSQDVTLTLTGLYPATRYSFTVSVVTECGRGNNSSDALGDTEIAAPPAPSGGTVNKITSSVANVTLWPISAITGKINFYLVYVRGVKDDNKCAQESSNLRCDEITQDAAKLPPNTKIFTIGDRKKYGQFENKELEKGLSYQVFQCGVTETLYGGMTKIAEGTVPENKEDEAVKQPQEKDNCTTERHLYIAFAVIAAIQLVVIVLLLVYIRQLKDRVKRLLSTERNHEETSPQERSVYENVAVFEKPKEDLQMSDITTTVAPEYDFIDPPPKEERHKFGQITSKCPSYSTKLSSPPHGVVKTSSNLSKHSTPSLSNADASTSSGIHPSGMYQPMELNQQTQDSVYEELNKNTMSKTPLKSDNNFDDRSFYQPLQGDAHNSDYQQLTLSGSSSNNVQI